MIQKIKNNVNGTAHIIIQKIHGEIFCFLGICATLVEKNIRNCEGTEQLQIFV
jgi:hypothetical protein